MHASIACSHGPLANTLRPETKRGRKKKGRKEKGAKGVKKKRIWAGAIGEVAKCPSGPRKKKKKRPETLKLNPEKGKSQLASSPLPPPETIPARGGRRGKVREQMQENLQLARLDLWGFFAIGDRERGDKIGPHQGRERKERPNRHAHLLRLPRPRSPPKERKRKLEKKDEKVFSRRKRKEKEGYNPLLFPNSLHSSSSIPLKSSTEKKGGIM